MSNKIGRNDPCPCDSGQKFKYCCIRKNVRERNLPIWENSATGERITLNMTDDMLNHLAQSELPLKNFCKDNDFYLFGLAYTVGQGQELDQQLQDRTLTKEMVLEIYKLNCKREQIMKLLELCCEELEIFNKRKNILVDAFEAHFDGKYTLSIPVLFTQLEGILREVGNIKNRDSIKPSIPTDIWESRLLFGIKDDAENYNNFITKLFAGNSSGDKLNRNPILHGFKIDYHSEEHSLLIMLSIMEIRLFMWYQNKTEDFTKQFVVSKNQDGFKIKRTIP